VYGGGAQRVCSMCACVCVCVLCVCVCTALAQDDIFGKYDGEAAGPAVHRPQQRTPFLPQRRRRVRQALLLQPVQHKRSHLLRRHKLARRHRQPTTCTQLSRQINMAAVIDVDDDDDEGEEEEERDALADPDRSLQVSHTYTHTKRDACMCVYTHSSASVLGA
jgi:hypothetical protein